MTSKEAATALFEATLGRSEAEARTIAKRLVERLSHGNRLFLLPAVLAEYEALARSRNIEPRVVAASRDETERLSAEIDSAKESLSVSENVGIRIDPSLVSGFIVEHNGKRIDASGRRRLLELYRQLQA